MTAAAFFCLRSTTLTELTEYRQEVRAWLEQNCPESMRSPYRSEAEVCWGGRDFKFQSKDQET